MFFFLKTVCFLFFSRNLIVVIHNFSYILLNYDKAFFILIHALKDSEIFLNHSQNASISSFVVNFFSGTSSFPSFTLCLSSTTFFASNSVSSLLDSSFVSQPYQLFVYIPYHFLSLVFDQFHNYFKFLLFFKIFKLVHILFQTLRPYPIHILCSHSCCVTAIFLIP